MAKASNGTSAAKGAAKKPAAAAAKAAKPAHNGAKAAKPPAPKPVAKSAPPAKAAPPAKVAKPKPAPPAPAPPAKLPGGKSAPTKVKLRPDLTGKILHLISEEMAIEEAELTPTASFKEDLGLDDIDIAELLMQAEQVFGVAADEDDWEGCETVGDFTKLIEGRIDPKRAKKV